MYCLRNVSGGQWYDFELNSYPPVDSITSHPNVEDPDVTWKLSLLHQKKDHISYLRIDTMFHYYMYTWYSLDVELISGYNVIIK